MGIKWSLACAAWLGLLAGCGKSDPHSVNKYGVDPDAARRAMTPSYSDIELSMAAAAGRELPMDGGPLVVYGISNCLVGGKYGPCTDEDCGHKLCGEARQQALRLCVVCRKPLGFGAEISCVDGAEAIKDSKSPFHAECHRAALPKICEKCGYPFRYYASEVLKDGSIVHKELECSVTAELERPSDDEARKLLAEMRQER